RKTAYRFDIPVMSSLRHALDLQTERHLTILVTEQGRPFMAAGFGNWVRERCVENFYLLRNNRCANKWLDAPTASVWEFFRDSFITSNARPISLAPECSSKLQRAWCQRSAAASARCSATSSGNCARIASAIA